MREHVRHLIDFPDVDPARSGSAPARRRRGLRARGKEEVADAEEEEGAYYEDGREGQGVGHGGKRLCGGEVLEAVEGSRGKKVARGEIHTA
ncbi:MAG: hypothetical protein LQ340_007662 [Diploschistes diacapsis]|nr:MAG: hypothetical protein LQ340_007662 [Diploschistes diacapsis]